MRFKIVTQKKIEDYISTIKVLELENDKTKDELIQTQRELIDNLKQENSILREMLKTSSNSMQDSGQGAAMIAPVNQKPRIRTMSEAAMLLSKKSEEKEDV